MQSPDALQWIDAGQAVSAEDLCHACRITLDELQEITAYGAPAPLQDGSHRLFAADWLMPLREATRLGRDYDLDLFAISLLAEHLRRIDALQAELRALRRRLHP